MARVHMYHMRRLDYCSGGVREFFARHGLDYPKFLQEGIDSEELLEACGHDHMAVQVVEVANGEQH